MDSDVSSSEQVTEPASTSEKPSILLQTRRSFLKALPNIPTFAVTGAALAAGGSAARYTADKIEGAEPSEIEKQFLAELSAAMMKAGKSGRPENVIFGDFTLTVQPTKNKSIER